MCLGGGKNYGSSPDVFFYMARGDDYIRQAASEMRTIRSLTRKSEGIQAGKRCITITVPAGPKAVKWAALEAARSSP